MHYIVNKPCFLGVYVEEERGEEEGGEDYDEGPPEEEQPGRPLHHAARATKNKIMPEKRGGTSSQGEKWLFEFWKQFEQKLTWKYLFSFGIYYFFERTTKLLYSI